MGEKWKKKRRGSEAKKKVEKENKKKRKITRKGYDNTEREGDEVEDKKTRRR
jgi:hypothetical protein